MHQPLSQRLQEILSAGDGASEVTLNHVLERTEGRGLYLVMVLLCLPFVAPVSVPGMSTVLGSIIAFIAFRLALGKARVLPKKIANRPLPAGLKKVLAKGGVKFLRFVEKAIRPRRTAWMNWRLAHAGNSLLIVFMAFLLALPLPPIPPFTNAFPSYAIILIAVSMMEEDGVSIWLGYAASLGTVIYFAVCAEVIGHQLLKWFHKFFPA